MATRPDLRMIVRIMESFHRSRFQSLSLDIDGATLSIRKPVAGPAGLAAASRVRTPVKSPSVGIFRIGGSLAAGHEVEASTSLGRVDKLDEAIAVEAGIAGILVEVAVTDGAFVEFGQPLFWVETDGEAEA